MTEYLNTWIGSSDPDSITLAGLDLPTEVMGQLTLTELAFLLVTRRRPTEHERRVADAVLVSLADHGFTPTALATRLTYTGAPESVQGAVAAGILGAGNVFLGPAGDTAQFLAETLGHHALDRVLADETVDGLALAAVERCRTEQRRVPGLGHPVHRAVDPRTPRIYEIASDEGLLGPHLRLLQGIAAANEAISGRRLPINGAGAGGAALADIGLPTSIIRGFVLIARTAGLVGHLAEEMDEPIGMALWQEVERRAAQRDA